jgi:hypothetical protein
MRKRKAMLITVLILSFFFTLSPFAQEKKGSEELYIIKQGDTLWDISAKFLEDPFLWPKLWQWNPYITNPHWIYPGNPVHFTAIEELKKEKPEKRVEEKPREVLQEPEVKKTEVKQPEVEKPEVPQEVPKIEKKPEPVPEVKPVEGNKAVSPELRSAGFFSDIDYRGIGTLLESKEGKTLMVTGDIVYLGFKTSEPVSIGDKFTIFRPSDVKDLSTDRYIGRRYNIIGNLQVIDQYGKFFTAKIIESFDAAFKGDMIRPYWKEKMEIGERKK